MYLRQIAFAVADLDAHTALAAELFDTAVGYNDPDVAVFGLRNALLPVGNDFYEFVSPRKDDTAAGRYMARRGGDTAYMLIFQSADGEGVAKRMTALGVRHILDHSVGAYRSQQFHPADLGGVLISSETVIGAAVPSPVWPPMGAKWREPLAAQPAVVFRRIDLLVKDRERSLERWVEGLQVRRDGSCLHCDNLVIAFEEAGERTPGIERIVVAARNAGERRVVELAGCRLEIEPA